MFTCDGHELRRRNRTDTEAERRGDSIPSLQAGVGARAMNDFSAEEWCAVRGADKEGRTENAGRWENGGASSSGSMDVLEIRSSRHLMFSRFGWLKRSWERVER